MTSRNNGLRRDSGFTLLEVLVAFVIAAIALSVMFESASGGIRSVRVSEHYEEAVSRAQSHLAALGRTGRIVPGEQAGDDGGGFRWRSLIRSIASSPLSASGTGVQQGPRAVLYAVSVAVTWDMDGSPRRVVLDSERLDIAASQGP